MTIDKVEQAQHASNSKGVLDKEKIIKDLKNQIRVLKNSLTILDSRQIAHIIKNRDSELRRVYNLLVRESDPLDEIFLNERETKIKKETIALTEKAMKKEFAEWLSDLLEKWERNEEGKVDIFVDAIEDKTQAYFKEAGE